MTSFIRQFVVTVFLLLLSGGLLPAKTFAQLLTGSQDAMPSGQGETSSPSYAAAQKARVKTPAPVYDGFNEELPVDLSADSMVHDDESQTIKASGHVEIIQGGRILRADEVQYNIHSDTVTAHGNVVLSDPNGDVHFADEVQLSNNMSSGFIKGLQSYLADGGRFIAKSGQREGNTITMHDASYTPCECDGDENGNPVWQLRAEEVTYHEDENKIAYKNARFELFGVPVAYTPYMAHSDGKVKRKSGLLTPKFAFASQLGGVLTSSYYWDVAPDKDLTIGTMLTTQEAPVVLGEYRQRFRQAELKLSGSTTYSGRTDRVGGKDISRKDDWRGHLFAETLWDINEKWRTGLNLEVASDDQYLRQYGFSGKNVLENELYVERFSGRNYAVGRLLAFQDLRIKDPAQAPSDQPNVLPEVEASFVGEPNNVLGGRWAVDLSALGLRRENGQDVNRVVAETGWQRRLVTNYGLVNTLDATLRGDAYSVRDRDLATAGSGRSNNSTETRLFSQIHVKSAYPVVKSFEKSQAVVEPVVALTLSPDINESNSTIPNEDSQDVQIDAGNLFEKNRFPGKDRVEDNSRLTYGIRTGLYGYEGSHADVFVGQSYRFDENDNPFPKGSGLSRQESDVVGQVSTLYKNRYGVDYRFQLDSRQLTSRRHEFDGFAHWDKFRLTSRYLFAKALGGTDIVETREQINGGAAYDFTDNWTVRSSALFDLGEDPGLRTAAIGLDYFGCCLSLSATATRRLTNESSGDNGTDIVLRLGLKGLGEFQSSGSGAP